jgi:ribosomal protein L37AE/L43A
MRDTQCPKCNSSDVVLHKVNDLLRAADPHGLAFEVRLQTPVWSCRACKLSWQGNEALAAKEDAYQRALAARSRSGFTPSPGARA